MSLPFPISLLRTDPAPYIAKVRRIAFANVAANQVQRDAIIALREQEQYCRAVKERAEAQWSDAFPAPIE